MCVLETRSPVCVLNCMHSLDVARGRGGEGEGKDLSPSLLLLSSFFVNPFPPSSPFLFPESSSSSSLPPLAYFLASTTGASPPSPSLSPSLSLDRFFCLWCPRELVLGHSKRRCVRVSSTLRLDGEEEGAGVEEDKTRAR